MDQQATFGVIIGNRGFFPDQLAQEGREEIIKVLEEQGFDVVIPSPDETKYGCVESWEDAQACAKLFTQHKEEIDGILVSLPNFGDEKAVATTLRLADLDVPVLIHAYPDDSDNMVLGRRRDSFCGKLSVCNNLTQYGIPFTLTDLHTVSPESQAFAEDLSSFASVCNVVKGLRRARIGAIGARPADFNTVRYSEKLLESVGISVETIDLSDVLGKIDRLRANNKRVKDKLEVIRSYYPSTGVPEESLMKMAKFGTVVSNWIEQNQLDGAAIQCWTALEVYYGIVPCTVMSMLSESLIPNACEVDVTGSLSMYALQLASGSPSAIVDWNNNFGDDPNKAVLFHCSNFPKSFYRAPQMSFQDIIAGTVGKENTFGTAVGQIKEGPITFFRMSTDDINGQISCYVGEGEITEDAVKTFGGWGVAKIDDLQGMLKYICENGFEHHVAINYSQVASVLEEALNKYLGWSVYHHNGGS
ncbi:MAG: L-fucose/L-arabinose isomerase family protein [Candidatus Bipolaricaulia bacterium]